MYILQQAFASNMILLWTTRMGHIWETVFGNNWAIWKWVVICNSILLKLVIENFLVVVFLLLWVSVHSLVDHLVWDVVPVQWESGQWDVLGASLHAAMLLISFTKSCNRQSTILLIVHVQKVTKPALITKFCIFNGLSLHKNFKLMFGFEGL